MAVIEALGLIKTYGKVRALKGVDLQVHEGQVFGLLGRNGAGKTTFVKIMLSLVRPTQGTARLLGEDPRARSVRKQIGFLPEDHRMPEYHTPWTLLDCSGLIYGMSRSERRRRTQELIELVGLKEWMHVKSRKFSKGMKQRLGLAQALLHDPKVLFLDEPTDGVDPIGRRDIRALIMKLKEQRKTVFINSHLLSEVEQTCDRVSIIDYGQVVREGTVDELTRVSNVYRIKVAGDPAPHLVELAQIVASPRWVDGAIEFAVTSEEQLDKAVDLLRSKRLGIRELREKSMTLEEVFMQTLSGSSA